MQKIKVLLMYITFNSGHYQASLSIENALKALSPGIETLNINAFSYTNPILERIINRTYLGVIRNTPEVWEYLYDNPKVLKSVQRLRNLIHRYNSAKLKILLDDFKPNAIVCTQAFPCGMVADYKKSFNLNVPLFGVLTDHAPHSYWIFDNVDYYIVPSEKTRIRLSRNGVPLEKICVFGIPINISFERPLDRDKIIQRLNLDSQVPTVLIMGGSQGIGPIEEVVETLEDTSLELQLIVVTGINKRLYKYIQRRSKHYKKRCLVYGYVDNIDELMEISHLIVTKPGGITTSEALAKSLPMIIVNPIPGQEAKNAEFLLEEGVVLKAEDVEDIVALIEELLTNRLKLEQMRRQAALLGKPRAAMDIANLVLGTISTRSTA